MQTLIQGFVGDGRHCLQYTAVVTEGGLTVTLTGGERSHVGAVAVAAPRPSLSDPAQVSASVSVITLLGHHDDELARPLGHLLAAESGQPAAVSVGIHWDEATAADIDASRRLAMEAGRAILAQLPSGANAARLRESGR